MLPSKHQMDHSALAQTETRELIDRLIDEGMDVRSVLAGVTSGLAYGVTTAYGPQAVPTWFMTSAGMTSQMGDD